MTTMQVFFGPYLPPAILVKLILLKDDDGLADVERDFVLGFGLEVVDGPDCLGHCAASMVSLLWLSVDRSERVWPGLRLLGCLLFWSQKKTREMLKVRGRSSRAEASAARTKRI